MTIYNIATFLAGIIVSATMFSMCDTFFERKPSFRKLIYNTAMLVYAVLLFVSSTLFKAEFLNVICILLITFGVTFLYDGKILFKAMMAILNYLLNSVTEVMVLFVITSVLHITAEEAMGDTVYWLFGVVVSKMLALFAVHILKAKFRKSSIYINASYRILLLLMFSSSIAAAFLIFKLSANITDRRFYNLAALCAFGLLFSTFFALYLYDNLAQQAETIRKQEQYEQSLQMQLKHLEEISVAQNQLKTFRHDFSNFCIGLKSYTDAGDLDGAGEYIESLQKIIIPAANTIETGNTAFDALVSAKQAIAESKGIRFTAQIQIPEQMNISPISVCIIFGNALDNALEACERVSAGDKRIALTAVYQNEMLFCRITNTAPTEDNPALATSKPDKANHGFGLANIKSELAKYGSEPTIIHGKGEFTLKFVIFLGK